MGGRVIKHLQISRSKPDEARNSPSGENLDVKISPSWPVSSMMGEARLEVRFGPWTSKQIHRVLGMLAIPTVFLQGFQNQFTHGDLNIDFRQEESCPSSPALHVFGFRCSSVLDRSVQALTHFCH